MRASDFLREYWNKEKHTGGAKGLPFPATYDQEMKPFKRKTSKFKQRIIAMTNENSSNTTTLANIYDGAYPDQDELIWNFVGKRDFDIPFDVQTIRPISLDQILCMQYGVDDIADLFRRMQPEQREIIKYYKKDPDLSKQIIVLAQDRIIDGNHRAVAAVLANKPIKYIDITEEQ